MSLCVLGLAEEWMDHGGVVNALWPRTAIGTAAIQNVMGITCPAVAQVVQQTIHGNKPSPHAMPSSVPPRKKAAFGPNRVGAGLPCRREHFSRTSLRLVRKLVNHHRDH
jgi:hypothetical protein